MNEITSSPSWSGSFIAEIDAMVKTPRISKEPSWSSPGGKTFKPRPSSRTRSKTTATPTQTIPWKGIETDAEPSILSAQDTSTPQSRPRKRRLVSKTQLGEDTHDGGGSAEKPTPKKRKPETPKKGNSDGEKRSRVFRRQPPQSYLLKLERATSQR